VDYRDVQIKGYLSTFKETTESDRDGDYVERGAFKETLRRFARNPVLLIDHTNSAESIAGSFRKIQEDESGLYMEAVLSNSQSERMKDVRAKVAEGHLKALSMGGLFHYKEDGRGIFKVDLWEGSLVAIPSNQDALFSVRALTEAEVKRLESERAP
jgi:HK97 family phage prohead protease